MSTKNTIYISLVALAVILLVTFVLQNTDVVLVNFLGWTFAPSVAALIVFTFIIGIFCGLTIDIIFSMANRKNKKTKEIVAPSDKNNNASSDNASLGNNITEVDAFTEIKDNDSAS
jgi:uncharacterized integral membrane protein